MNNSLVYALQNSALFPTIPENFRKKKTVENTGLSRVLHNPLFCLKLSLIISKLHFISIFKLFVSNW